MSNQLKIFATDMDGTFLDENRAYDKSRLRDILKEFKKRNYLFCAASGRQLLALEELFDEFQDQVAFCAENGALVKYQGEILYSSILGQDKASKLVELVRQNPHMHRDVVLFSGLNGAYALQTADPQFVEFANLYYSDLKLVQSVHDIEDEILKVCVEFPPEQIRECEDWINAQMTDIRATTTGFRSIDIMSAGISKATGLSHLLTHLQSTPETLTAFGDQSNDLEMLQLAGTAVAVENAIPEVLKISDKVIGHNRDAAVLTELEAILAY
ncbi:Cof-type HAD-IIB family hydrolase [Lactococcus garvieae]|uniref:Cof-type HAD-IIB family hydrolase n=1 Tax=Lactococcus garvieae TaxID=1363 RepID=UPI0038530F9C